MSTITLMALDPTLRLALNLAVQAEVDGSSHPLVMITVEKFSQPYEHEAGLQRRTDLIHQLQLSGWRLGSSDGTDDPPLHAWSATWDTNQTLRLLHKSITTPFVSAVVNAPEAESWRQALRASARITGLFITTPADCLGGASSALHATAEGRFLYIEMPLHHT